MLGKKIMRAPAAIRAPTMITLEMALVIAIKGECKAGVTPPNNIITNDNGKGKNCQCMSQIRAVLDGLS